MVTNFTNENSSKIRQDISPASVCLGVSEIILQAKKFLKCDWLRPVVFEVLTCKYYSFHGNLNDRKSMAEIFPKGDGKKLQELKEISNNANNKERTIQRPGR